MGLDPAIAKLIVKFLGEIKCTFKHREKKTIDECL